MKISEDNLKKFAIIQTKLYYIKKDILKLKEKTGLSI